jgi:hypothetical protein
MKIPYNTGWRDSSLPPEAITCGDLDGDGDLEIIVASQQGITIYENKTEQKK